MTANRELPNVAATLGRVLARVAESERPLLVAIAERLAAERYRGWAGHVDEPARAQMLACAAREEAIASRVESLHADAAARQQAIRDANPDLVAINRSVFEGFTLTQQLAIQAQGERAGAALWRGLAEKSDARARAAYLACASLEEESAEFLESLPETSG